FRAITSLGGRFSWSSGPRLALPRRPESICENTAILKAPRLPPRQRISVSRERAPVVLFRQMLQRRIGLAQQGDMAEIAMPPERRDQHSREAAFGQDRPHL